MMEELLAEAGLTLKQLDARYAKCESGLVVIGDTAARIAHRFQMPCRDVLAKGCWPANDPAGRQIIATMLSAVLPEPDFKGQLCGVTLPAGIEPLQAVKSRARQRRDPGDAERIMQLVRLHGYEPVFLPAGLAVVLAESADSGFTGLGIDFGSGATNFSLARQGVEIARCSIPLGSRWIDERAARACAHYGWDPKGHRFSDLEAIGQWKLSLEGTLAAPANPREHVLAALYTDMLEEVLNEGGRTLASHAEIDGILEPVSLVYAGGPTLIPGFSNLLESVLTGVSLPVKVDDIRGTRCPWTIARGALVYAELERRTLELHAA
ncbi:MAG: hypothetical protein ACC652_05240, partial [Acidimicrobiales bacterium]